jgi:hypothetical protein
LNIGICITQVCSSKERLKIGNDAHYTLVAFKAMCTRSPTVQHVIKEKAPAFSIRDLVPNDLIDKPTNKKPPAPPPVVDLKLTLSDFLSRSGKDETTPHRDDSSQHSPAPPNGKIRRKYFPDPAAQQSPTQVPDVGVRVEDDLSSKDSGAALKKLPAYIPPHKRVGASKVESKPLINLVDEFPPLPTVCPSLISPSHHRDGKRDKVVFRTHSAGLIFPPASVMDTVRNRSAIDDLNAAFGGTTEFTDEKLDETETCDSNVASIGLDISG